MFPVQMLSVPCTNIIFPVQMLSVPCTNVLFRYKGTNPPPGLGTGGKTMKIFFKSNKKKHGVGASCIIECYWAKGKIQNDPVGVFEKHFLPFLSPQHCSRERLMYIFGRICLWIWNIHIYSWISLHVKMANDVDLWENLLVKLKYSQIVIFTNIYFTNIHEY